MARTARMRKLASDASRYSFWIAMLLTSLLSVATSRAQDSRRSDRAAELSAAAVALKDPGVQVRVDAATALASMTDSAGSVIPLLGEALRDPSYYVRRTAALGLAKLAPSRQEAIELLAYALADTDPAVQDNAVWGLQTAGPAAFPVLTRALQAEDARVRLAAVEVLQTILALGGARGVSPRAVEALIDALSDSNPDVRAASARSLGILGPPARDAVAQLRTVSDTDRVDYVRDAATDALQKITRTP